MKLAQQKLSKDCADVAPSTGMLLISAHIVDSLRRLQSFRMWDNGMDINSEDETSHTTQYEEACLKYLQNEYCAKHRHVPVNEHDSLPRSHPIPCETVSGSCQSSFDPYDLSGNDEDYTTPHNVAENPAGRSDRAAR